MEQTEPASRPEPPGAFGHPAAAALREGFSDVSAGFDDQQGYASESPQTAGDRPAVMPPRAAEDVSREPLVQRDKRSAGEVLRLEALECASRAFLARLRLADALLAAQAAVDTEPLRESTRRLLVEVQLARGNVVEAIRCYQDYREQLRAEFGVDPSPAMANLLQPWQHHLPCS